MLQSPSPKHGPQQTSAAIGVPPPCILGAEAPSPTGAAIFPLVVLQVLPLCGSPALIGYIFDATPDAAGSLLAAVLPFSQTRVIKPSMTLARIWTCIAGPWMCHCRSSCQSFSRPHPFIPGWSFWRVFLLHPQLQQRHYLRGSGGGVAAR